MCKSSLPSFDRAPDSIGPMSTQSVQSLANVASWMKLRSWVDELTNPDSFNLELKFGDVERDQRVLKCVDTKLKVLT